MRPTTATAVSGNCLRGRIHRAALSLLVVVSVLLATSGPLAAAGRPNVRAGHSTAALAFDPKPDIVLILTDDQRWDMLTRMPHVRDLLVDHGVNFSNGFVVNSLCCPSRATILTGQYSHSTGIYTTGGADGGYHAFRDGSTVSTWLHAAGYHTGLLGKYLNGYDDTRIPPGWDRWFAFQQNNRANYYYNYQVTDQGTIRTFGTAPEDYSTSVLANRAVRFIDTATGPLFLYVAPYAPHAPANPAPPDVSAFSNMKPARSPNYNERDVSDKPAWVRALPRMTAEVRAKTDELRVNQYRSLLAVDRMVGRIVHVLTVTGRLSHTMLVFTSDNGLALGEHRWANQKQAAYEESIRVPFVVRYDPLVSSPRTDRHFVANLDLAPTFAEAAAVQAPGAEGRSLLPILASSQALWRRDFLVEHLRSGAGPTTFCAVRRTRFLYVEYEGGEEELYDLRADPYQLENAVGIPEDAQILGVLRARTRELCEPPPPGFTFSH